MKVVSPQQLPKEYVLFPIRYPQAEDRKDGFYQRVQAIDDLFREHFPRVYLRTDGSVKQLKPIVVEIEKDCYEVKISRRNPWQKKLAVNLISQSKALYLHSILSAEAPLIRSLLSTAKCKVLDLHGSVPEEAEMMEQHDRVELLNLLEKEIVSKIDLMVGVSERLNNHIKKKHQYSKNRLIMPILPAKKTSELNWEEKEKGLVIYSGGTQVWQMVDEMMKFANNHPEMRFIFLTKNREEMQQVAKDRIKKGIRLEVQSVPPSELPHWYEKAEYGLILREDSIVNQVASPTKLTEYLQYGMVPLVYSSDIGDFEKLGYQFGKVTEPLPANNLEIARHNMQIYQALVAQYEKGQEQLLEFVSLKN